VREVMEFDYYLDVEIARQCQPPHFVSTGTKAVVIPNGKLQLNIYASLRPIPV
jgi:hypothetical protein